MLHEPPLACSICPLKPVGAWDPWVGVEKGVHWVQAARKSYLSSQLRATGHDIGFAIIFSYDHDFLCATIKMVLNNLKCTIEKCRT